jgi:RHS repeat-associated protein
MPSVKYDGSPGYNGTEAGGGLVFMRNRWYDPNTGRFTQEDPIGFAGGINLYAYAGNDPVTYSDPFGLCPPKTMAEVFLCTGRMLQPIEGKLEVAGAIVTAPLSGGMGMMGRANVPIGLGAAAAASVGRAAAAGGDHIVLGLQAARLGDVAREVGGRTLRLGNFRAEIDAAIRNPNVKITISLDGLDGATAAEKLAIATSRGAGGLANGATNWEIYQLSQAGRLGSAQLVEAVGTRIVPNPIR